MKPEAFLATYNLFTRAELVAALRGRANATVDAHLARWRRQGRIVRVKQGVFVRLNKPGAPNIAPPDFIALASRMAPDAAVSYHTALEAHGFAQSLFERLTFVTWTKTKPVSFQGRRFVPVRPRAGLLAANRGEQWIERFERAGIEVRVTNVERTVVDVLDRLDLAGGVEEVWRSLQSIPALDLESLENYITVLGGSLVAAKVGFYLETRREELAVPEKLLKRLRSRIPATPSYVDRRRRGRVVAGWSLIVPQELLASGAEDPE